MTEEDVLTKSLTCAMRNVDKLACQVAAAEVEIRKLRLAFNALARGEIDSPAKYAATANIESLTRYTCTEQQGDYSVTLPDPHCCEE